MNFEWSKEMGSVLLSHMARAAHEQLPEEIGFNTVPDLAANCFFAYERPDRTCGTPPLDYIQALTKGILPKIQINLSVTSVSAAADATEQKDGEYFSVPSIDGGAKARASMKINTPPLAPLTISTQSVHFREKSRELKSPKNALQLSDSIPVPGHVRAKSRDVKTPVNTPPPSDATTRHIRTKSRGEVKSPFLTAATRVQPDVPPPPSDLLADSLPPPPPLPASAVPKSPKSPSAARRKVPPPPPPPEARAVNITEIPLPPPPS